MDGVGRNSWRYRPVERRWIILCSEIITVTVSHELDDFIWKEKNDHTWKSMRMILLITNENLFLLHQLKSYLHKRSFKK